MFMLRIQIIRNSSVEGVPSGNSDRMKLHKLACRNAYGKLLHVCYRRKQCQKERGCVVIYRESLNTGII